MDLKTLEELARQDDMYALYQLGQKAEYGSKTKFQNYLKAAELGHMVAAFLVGQDYWGTNDLLTAFKWLSKVAIYRSGMCSEFPAEVRSLYALCWREQSLRDSKEFAEFMAKHSNGHYFQAFSKLLPKPVPAAAAIADKK